MDYGFCNPCPKTLDNYNVPYSSLVHEAGHALGIRGGRDGVDQQRFHPSEMIIAQL